MNERANFKFEKISSLGATERADQVVQRDLELVYGGKTYILSVANAEYLAALKRYNQNFPEEMKLDENVLVLENVNSIDSVVKALLEMAASAVFPYLTRQVNDQP